MAWSGGLIDWNSQYVQANGYYYSLFKEVNVQCYDTPPKANVSGSNSYIYTGTDGVESDISVTNDQTVLKSLLGTGTDRNKDFPHAAKPSGTKSASASASAAATEVATVPGLTGAGPGTDGTRGGGSTGNSGSGGEGGSNGGSQSSSAAGSAATGIGGFSQGGGSSGGTKSSSEAPKTESFIRGSAFAALVAFFAMLMM